MKKIYSLLLLGAFLLLGAQSAWGTDYYYRGDANNWEAATDAQKLLQVGTSNIFKIELSGVSSNHQFKIFEEKNDWSAKNYYSDNIDGSRSNVNIFAGSNGNISFAFPGNGTVDVTIYLDKTNDKVYVVTDLPTVTFYVTVPTTNVKRVDPYDGDGYHYFGASGFQMTQTETINGVTYYKHDIGVPSGTTLKVKFYADDKNASEEKVVGEITANTSVYYALDAENGFAKLAGSWDKTGDAWNLRDFEGIEKTVSFTEGDEHYFMLVYGSNKWCGGSSDPTVINSEAVTAVSYNGGSNFKFVAPYTGTYKFYTYWSGTDLKLKIEYPLTYSRSLASGNYGTICLPKAITAVDGASFYTVAGYRGASATDISSVVLTAASLPLTAGKPYIMKATKSTQSFTLTGALAALQSGDNGLVGTYSNTTVPYDSENITTYIIQGTTIRRVVGDAVTCGAAHAYMNFDGIDALSGDLAPDRYFEMPLAPENGTNIENIEANEKTIKFFKDGQLFILKSGVVYDMTGRAVK